MTCIVCGSESEVENQTCDRACSYVLRSSVRVLRGSPNRQANKTTVKVFLKALQILGEEEVWVSGGDLASRCGASTHSLMRALKFAKPYGVKTRFEGPPVKALTYRLEVPITSLSEVVGSERIDKARSVFLK
jgi:predicted nucleic acid-binding Zn ribbon protein